MYTKSNQKGISHLTIGKRIAVTMVLFFTMMVTMAQVSPVSVNIMVMPPYTSSISDYMTIPNKIVITLTHTALDYPDIELYLKVGIVGDNGVSALSEDDFKPSVPISLPRGSSRIVNMDNISDAFNLQHIIIEGTTLNELVNGSGLPEGNYQICVRAFDFATSEPLSGEEPIGCSNLFSITNLEPPTFNTPICGEPQINYGPQMVNVSWSIPSGASFGTTYHFEIVEIPENVDIDPNEAFLMAKYPVLYEETSTQTMTILTVDKVSLNSGYTYVMRVTAEDPSGKVHFRNGGSSEVCWFKYEKQALGGNNGEIYIRFVLPSYNDPDSVLTANTVSGFHSAWRIEPFDTLVYKDPLSDYPGSVFLVEFFNNDKGKNPILSATTSKTYYHADPIAEGLPFESGKSYWEKVSIINSVSKEVVLESDLNGFKYQYDNLGSNMEVRTVNGKIEYKFEKDDPASYPVASANVKLMTRFILNDTLQGVKIPVPIDKIPMEIVDPTVLNYLSQPLAIGTTLATGNFTLTYNWPENIKVGELKSDFSYSTGEKNYTGTLTLVLYTVLDNPYYSGIDQQITYDVNPCNLGTIYTYVYSYKLNAVVYEGYKDAPGIKKNLENKEVYILRKGKKAGLPSYEGDHTQLFSRSYSPAEVKNAGYSVVASEITKASKDKNGKDISVATFTRLIQNLVNGDDYYLWIKGSSIYTAEPFRYYVSMSEMLSENTTGYSGQLNINGTNFSIPGGTNNLQTNNSQSFTFNTNNIVSVNNSNSYTLQGNNSGSVQNLVNQPQSVQNAGNNFNQFTQTGGENFIVPGFNFDTDKITASSGTFSDISNYSFTVETSFTLVTNQPPMSGISGRIVYEFPAKAGNARPLNNRKISLISCLVSDEPGEASKLIKTNSNAKYSQAFPGVYTLYTSKTDANGNFNFQFPNILPTSSTPDPTEGQYYLSTGKLNRDASWISWESDPGTEFEIVYAPKQVKVKRVLRIVIEDEAGIFLSPCDNIQIDPLKSADVGTINAEVFSYKLKGETIRNWDETKPTTNALGNPGYYTVFHHDTIKGTECFVLREKSQIDALGLPVDEGQNIVGELPDKPNLKIISYTTSDSKGAFAFDNLIFRNVTAPVYLYFRTKDMMGNANYEPVWQEPKVNKFAKPVYFFKNDYNYTAITGFGTSMEPKNPTLKGRVISDVNVQKGLNQALVTATMSFSNYNDYVCQIQTDTTGKFDFTSSFNYIFNGPWGKYLTHVTLKIEKPGFHYMENGVRKGEYFDTFDKAYFEKGKQLVLDNIHLYSNGSIKGRIVNESGIPVDAYVQFLENSTGSKAVETGEMHKTGGSYALVNIALGQSGGYESNGKFQIPAVPGNNRKLVVIPKDVTYFSDTLTLNVSNFAVTDLGDIKVYERSHRIYFYVKKTSGGIYAISSPIAGAKVSIVGSANIPPFTSDADGKVVMNFKNVSESNLTLKVSGPFGSNYVPKNIAFTNAESETPVKLPTVYLEQGLTVKGKVLLDGNPTADAEVYVELSKYSQTEVETGNASDGGKTAAEAQYLFTARPKSDGTFEINTIPPELANKQITLKVVYKKASPMLGLGHGQGQSGNAGNQSTGIESGQGISLNESHGSTVQAEKTIIGESKQVLVPETTGNLTLKLTTFNDMIIKDLWGFPLEITKLEKIPNTNKVKIEGRVKPEGFSPGFDPLEPLTMEVKLVEFQPSDQKVGGIPVGIPVESKVYVASQRMLKLKYAKAYNVKLSTYDNSLFAITRENAKSDNGIFNATVQVIDNSFQFPSSYLNFEGVDFYFCKPYSFHNTTMYTPVIDVFNSSNPGNGNSVVKYNICNLGGYNSPVNDLKFKFINFETTASKANSFIEGDQITLDAKLHASVKNGGEVEVEVGKLVLKNNTIAPISGSTPLIITLKDGGIHNADKEWKFEARDWVVDAKVGGLESKNCMLHTGTIDIPYSYFNLRSDFAYLGNPDCTKLNMAGYPVKLRGAETTTGYNASCGSDGQGHWQLIIHPASSGPYAGMSPAYVENLPNMHANLELETVSLLSNGEDVFTIGTGAAKMKLYDVVDFKPQTVFTLNDGLVLSGALDFHIPRVKKGIGTSLTFRKSQPIASNPIPDPIDIGFEAKGNVKFSINPTGQKFDTANKTFTTFGSVEEPGKLDPIQVLLTYHSNTTIGQIKTDIIETPAIANQKVKIGEENTFLEKVKCSMNADQTDWSLLKFEGDMLGFNGVKEGSNKHMEFTVHGEIEAEQNEFGADGINYEFGGMKISYQKGRLLGSLAMENVPMGPVIVSGMANILMDSDGWAFYSNASANGVPCPDNTTVYMGILIGNYPTGITADMSNVVLKYAVKKQMPETFNEGLKGFFMVGGRNLPISGLDIGIDVVVASAYVRVPVAAVDASFYMNFVNGKEVIGTGLNGRLILEFGLESITCTDLYGGAYADVYAGGIYNNGSLNFSGGASFGADLTVSQGIPYLAGCIDAVSISVPTINGGFDFNLNPFDVNMYLGTKSQKPAN